MMDLQDINSYNARRERLRMLFNTFRHGAQMDASHELWMSPSIISGVLRGRYVDEKKLVMLEEWAAAHAEEYLSHEARQLRKWSNDAK